MNQDRSPLRGAFTEWQYDKPTMSEWTAEDLLPEESELIIDFVEWAGEFDRQILDRQTIDGDEDTIGLAEAFEYLTPLISEEADEFDAQVFRLFRLRGEIQSGPVFDYKKEDELPENPKVTPEELNRFVKKDELEEFFTLAGQMIEKLTIDLVLEDVVEPSRRSNSVRKKVEQMSQYDREWLLYVTGVITDGDKGEIRRAYGMRSSIVHSSNGENDFLNEIEIPSDVSRALDAVDILHEKLHTISLGHRFGDLIA